MPNPLTRDQQEAAFDMADDLFEIMMSVDNSSDLQDINQGDGSPYLHTVAALTTLFERLGVPSGDHKDVMKLMGDGSPAEEAIYEVQADKESPS